MDESVAAGKPEKPKRTRVRGRGGKGKEKAAPVKSEDSSATQAQPVIKTEQPDPNPNALLGSIQPAEAAAMLYHVATMSAQSGQSFPFQPKGGFYGKGSKGGGGKPGKGKPGKAKTKTKTWPTANIHPNPVPPGKWGQKPGDWKCPSCNGFNFSYRPNCFFCSQVKPS